MGKGHKDRRREKRAREFEEQDKDVALLKDELQEEQEILKQELLKKQDEKTSNETLSDTDSGHGTSTTTVTDSPKMNRQDETVELLKRKTSVKGLINIGNTCFFNVIVQSLSHTSLLIDTLYRTLSVLMNGNGRKYSSTTTAQLMMIFDEFTLPDRKKQSIDPKPLFNSLIQKIPTYKGYDQHDTHELFMNLMLILRAEEAELRHLPNRQTVQSENDEHPSKMFCLIGCNEPYTTYDSIFGGHLLDVITCKKCEKSLMKIEPFLGLLLPLTDRMSPTENYKNRRKRDEYTGNKSKKETKTLSRKQLKALAKHEKKNQRRSAASGSGKIRNRQAAKKKNVEEDLPPEETTETSMIEQVNTPAEEEKPTDENVEEKPVVEEKPIEESAEEEEDDDDDDDEEEVKKSLTTTESVCVLADMVSKLTLIHETSSRPLPFVDQTIAQKFLNCLKTTKNTSEITDTDNIKALADCFQRYFKPEILSGENLFDCYYCRSNDPTQKRVFTEAIRQTVFFQLPPVIPIFLKRFQMYGSHSEKINKFIEFPLELDLTDRCSSQIPTNSSTYSLYAVIEHTGTLRSGHYVAYVKQSIDDYQLPDDIYSKPIDLLLTDLFKTSTSEQTQSKSNETNDPSVPPSSWYYISDNSIHKVPESKVLQADAYVLFYRRT